MARGVLVLDMDGTVVLGDDPVRRYAAAAGEANERVAARVTKSVFTTGSGGRRGPERYGTRDR